MRRFTALASLALASVVAVTAAGCAARQPVAAAAPTQPPPAVNDLAALMARGCYRCLEQAFEQAQARGATAQAFESAVLLALRSKELGLPSHEWLARARETAPGNEASATYLAIADAIPPDRLSDEREAAFDVSRRSTTRASIEQWRELLQNGPGSEVFRAYLDVSLVCAYGRLATTAQSRSGTIDPVAETPLHRYAVGHCDSAQAADLAALRAGDTEFVDADYALGRYAIENATDPNPEEGLRRLRSAADAFPRSPAIATWIGHVYRGWEEWAAALDAYDAALAMSPNHPEALIGRTISQSQLGLSFEAIETATKVIDAAQWMVGEAYYWRAWNQLRLAHFPEARLDTDRARTMMANARVFVLSGVVEWRLRHLEAAERDFQQAVTIDLGECEAAFDLGIVRDELRKPAEALAAFRQAGQCNDLSIRLRHEAIAKIMAGPGSDSAKARNAARHERALADLEERGDEIVKAIDALEKDSGSRSR